MATVPRDQQGASPPGPPTADHDPSSGGTLADALHWEPQSRLGQLAMGPIGRVPGPRLLRAHQISTGIAIVFANLVGVAILLVLNVFVIPGSPLPKGDGQTVTIAVVSTYLVSAFLIGGALIVRESNKAWRWLPEHRKPTQEEELGVLRAPVRVFVALVILWTIGTVVAMVTTLAYDWRLGLRVGITTLIGGLSTSAFGYLLTERVMRPAARVVLPHRDPDAPPALPPAGTRQLLTWALGTGAAMFGVWIVGLLVLTGAITPQETGRSLATQLEDQQHFTTRLAVVMLVLGSISLTVGLIAEVFTARAVADPIRGLRRAVQRLTDGDLTARVTLNDATEIGLLQAGFNRMAAGIEEREELRDLFGRHVGGEVADTALERGAELGGETLHVAALFVDVVGSTSLAMQRPAHEVVELINRFFDIVVTVTGKHGGLVNKFAGDGALVVFGAPSPLEDTATPALQAARELARALEEHAPETPATIGLSGGEVIAGNMGTQERFEYTVMGDPVNEAARLNSQAKGLPGRVAAAGRLVAEASEAEQAHWEVLYSVVLRGRSERTDVASLRTKRTPTDVR
ncbi:MAG: HAMP domain-containing protein [Solirubrobacteraceae bacterium]|nr:HAMP domain-containing protein [Solirubrobacteraceae bacterium]